ncbi:MAG TPA: anhydro-N-acetylmuramic acid kinase [Rhodanobacteraceae bacterium]
MSDADGLYIGLMSGTSADAIDAALCSFVPRPRLLAALEHPWPAMLRRQLLTIAQGEQPVDLDALGHLDTAIGNTLADAAGALLAKAGVAASAVRAIGSHGQTLRHRPDGPLPFTLQLGDAWVIAEHTGIDTVADFRRADVAAGGQGAPLLPAFHSRVLATPGQDCAVVNLGGIANLTLLAADGHVLGFDTGPANGLMDAWCQRHRGKPYDHDGAFAASGHCDQILLDQLLADAYFQRPPPKSTGREYFQLAWLDGFPRVAQLAPADVQTTLLALTVESIARALHDHAPDARSVFLCGGGVHNAALLRALTQALTPRTVASTAVAGVDPDYLEAMGFAWLARQHLLGLPGNLPAVTGARGLRVLGSLHTAMRPHA